MLTTWVKILMRYIARNDRLWELVYPLARAVDYLLHERKIYEGIDKTLVPYANELEYALKSTIFTSKVVLNGPFRGMKYPFFESAGSALLCKLIGSYESELHKHLERLLVNNSYPLIIDIGCAEGYYAVGLARRLQESKILAFDVNKRARYLCLEMAKINNVEQQIEIAGRCTPQALLSLPKPQRGLVICDCEGYEDELFTPSLVEQLSNYDLIIETHDIYKLGISLRLKERFKLTHHCTSVYSLNDIEKAYTYSYPETNSMSLEKRYLIFKEERVNTMEWLIFEPQISKY